MGSSWPRGRHLGQLLEAGKKKRHPRVITPGRFNRRSRRGQPVLLQGGDLQGSSRHGPQWCRAGAPRMLLLLPVSGPGSCQWARLLGMLRVRTPLLPKAQKLCLGPGKRNPGAGGFHHRAHILHRPPRPHSELQSLGSQVGSSVLSHSESVFLVSRHLRFGRDTMKVN